MNENNYDIIETEYEGHTLHWLYNACTETKQLIITESLACVCGKQTIEELMEELLEDDFLDWVCEKQKEIGVTPLVNKHQKLL